MATARRYWLPAVLIVVAFSFPMWNNFLNETVDVNLMYPVVIITIYIMLALGLNIVVGFAGLLDLGFVAFYALGAYVCRLVCLGSLRPGEHLVRHHRDLHHRGRGSGDTPLVLDRPDPGRRLLPRSAASSSARRPCGCGATTWR